MSIAGSVIIEQLCRLIMARDVVAEASFSLFLSEAGRRVMHDSM